jgi:hypothetical protein
MPPALSDPIVVVQTNGCWQHPRGKICGEHFCQLTGPSSSKASMIAQVCGPITPSTVYSPPSPKRAKWGCASLATLIFWTNVVPHPPLTSKGCPLARTLLTPARSERSHRSLAPFPLPLPSERPATSRANPDTTHAPANPSTRVGKGGRSTYAAYRLAVSTQAACTVGRWRARSGQLGRP